MIALFNSIIGISSFYIFLVIYIVMGKFQDFLKKVLKWKILIIKTIKLI